MAFQSLLGKEKGIGSGILRPLAEIALGCTLAYVVGKWVYEMADPTQKAKREAKEMVTLILGLPAEVSSIHSYICTDVDIEY